MHFYFYVRGIMQQVELFKAMAQSQFFKISMFNVTENKEQTMLVQGALRPSILGTYEFIFPENALPDVLKILNLDDKTTGADFSFINYARLGVLRKILGLKKIPKKAFKEAEKVPASILLQNSNRGLSHLKIEGVAIHPIGIKYDKKGFITDDKTGIVYKQELL